MISILFSENIENKFISSKTLKYYGLVEYFTVRVVDVGR